MATISKQKSATRTIATDKLALLVATRKGAFILKADGSRRKWETTDPCFSDTSAIKKYGADPRDGRTMLVAVWTGFLTDCVRSTDFGANWKKWRSRRRSRKFPKGKKAASGSHFLADAGQDCERTERLVWRYFTARSTLSD